MASPNWSWQTHQSSPKTWNGEGEGDENENDKDDEWLWSIEEYETNLGEEMIEETQKQDGKDSVTGPVKNRRCVEYGTGRDAQRTAPYRYYPADQSPVLREVKCRCCCDKLFLMRLIRAVLNDSEVKSRPAEPTRSEKRCRGGLIHWLDFHAELVFKFLASHPQFS
jgi:hypothetical protein